MPSLFGGEEEGVLQTRQPLGLEAEPRNRGLPITGSQSPGPNQTKTKQTKKQTRLGQGELMRGSFRLYFLNTI